MTTLEKLMLGWGPADVARILRESNDPDWIAWADLAENDVETEEDADMLIEVLTDDEQKRLHTYLWDRSPMAGSIN